MMPKRQLDSASLLLVVGGLAVLSGCDLPVGPARDGQRHGYPVVAWYNVGGRLPGSDAQARNVMTSDFAHIRSLGFNTIVVDAVGDDRRTLLLDAAEKQSLGVILLQAETMAYVRQGSADDAALREFKASVRKNVEAVARRPALYMYYVYDAPTRDVGNRLAVATKLYKSLDPAHGVFVRLSRDPAALVKQADLPVVLWDNFPITVDAAPGTLMNRRYPVPATHAEALAEIYTETPGRQHWVMIQAVGIPGQLRMPTPAEWDLMYMTALAAGYVDGVVFYRYHADEEPDTGLSLPNHSMPPERARAVRRITKRAMTWGPALQGTSPSFESVRIERGRLRAALLSGPKRQFLLVFNPDVETFGQDTVFVPATVQGRRIARAVNLDDPKRYLPQAATGEIPVPLRLRPGDGRLLELFGPSAPTGRSLSPPGD